MNIAYMKKSCTVEEIDGAVALLREVKVLKLRADRAEAREKKAQAVALSLREEAEKKESYMASMLEMLPAVRYLNAECLTVAQEEEEALADDEQEEEQTGNQLVSSEPAELPKTHAEILLLSHLTKAKHEEEMKELEAKHQAEENELEQAAIDSEAAEAPAIPETWEAAKEDLAATLKKHTEADAEHRRLWKIWHNDQKPEKRAVHDAAYELYREIGERVRELQAVVQRLNPETQALIELCKPDREKVKGVKYATAEVATESPNGFRFLTDHLFNVAKWCKPGKQEDGVKIWRLRYSSKYDKFFEISYRLDYPICLALHYDILQGRLSFKTSQNNAYGQSDHQGTVQYQGNPGELIEAMEAIEDFDGLLELLKSLKMNPVFKHEFEDKERDSDNKTTGNRTHLETAYTPVDGAMKIRFVQGKEESQQGFFKPVAFIESSGKWSGKALDYWTGWVRPEQDTLQKTGWIKALNWAKGLGLLVDEIDLQIMGTASDASMVETMRNSKGIIYTAA